MNSVNIIWKLLQSVYLYNKVSSFFMLTHNSSSWFDQMWTLKANFHQINWQRRNRVISTLHWIKKHWRWIQWSLKAVGFLCVHKIAFMGDRGNLSLLHFLWGQWYTLYMWYAAFTDFLWFHWRPNRRERSEPYSPSSDSRVLLISATLPHLKCHTSFPMSPLMSIQFDLTITWVA